MRKFLIVQFLLLIVFITSCVTKNEYDNLKEQTDWYRIEKNNVEDKYEDLQRKYNKLMIDYNNLKNNYNNVENGLDRLRIADGIISRSKTKIVDLKKVFSTFYKKCEKCNGWLWVDAMPVNDAIYILENELSRW